MDEEQTKIARSLARFREVIADRRVDGRFAVTTMDLGGEGVVFERSVVSDGSTPVIILTWRWTDSQRLCR